jgi:hypothetical protein
LRLLSLTFSRANVLIPALLLASAWPAQAVQWTLASAVGHTWTYTLTFDPLDNYSIYQANTTITMSGLYGVTNAGAPTSTDFPSNGALQLLWTPQVLNGGTSVVWTHVGSGTGNFSQTLHVFGFTITAPSAVSGNVSFATSGMSLDAGSQSSVTSTRATGNARRNVSVAGIPLGSNLDISGTVLGPALAGSGSFASAPAMSPFALLVTALGLALAGGYQARARLMGRLGIGG